MVLMYGPRCKAGSCAMSANRISRSASLISFQRALISDMLNVSMPDQLSTAFCMTCAGCQPRLQARARARADQSSCFACSAKRRLQRAGSPASPHTPAAPSQASLPPLPPARR